MNEKNEVLRTVISYLIWAILAAGAVLLLFSTRTAFIALLARYSAQGFDERMAVGALDKFFMIGAGVAALGIIMLIEHYLTKADGWPVLIRRTLLFLGIFAAVLTVNTGIIQIVSKTFFTSFVSAVAFLLPLAGTLLLITGSRLLKSGNKQKTG